MATYAIGDVHGCYRELNALLEKIQYQDSDTLWFVGDLVNRGPDSLSVLRMIHALPKRVVVLGNHDLHLLALYHGVRHFPINECLAPVLAAPDADELCGWLQQQDFLHYDADRSLVMVHAGIWPLWNLAQVQQAAQQCERALRSGDASIWSHLYGNEPAHCPKDLDSMDALRFMINALTRMRYCYVGGGLELTENRAPSDCARDDIMPWYVHPQCSVSGVQIIFGHWASLKGQVSAPGIHAIDTGCAWGETLTALCVDDGQRVCVPFEGS